MMSFLVRPQQDAWLAVRSGISTSNLAKRITSVDVCLSNLDDTDALSPARKIVLNGWYERSKKDPKYRQWLFQAIFSRLWEKESPTKLWADYVEKFLGTPELKSAAAKNFGAEQIQDSVFPQVGDFYALLSADKYYVTENIPEIAGLYGQTFGFQDVFTQIQNKGELAEKFVHTYPHYKKYLVRGNAEKDQEMVDVLRSCMRSRKIDDLVSIYIATRPLHEQHGFDVEVGRNQRELVKLIQDNQI